MVGYYFLTCRQWRSCHIRCIHPIELTNLFAASSFTSLVCLLHLGHLDPCIIERTASADRVLKTNIGIFFVCPHDLSRLNASSPAGIMLQSSAVDLYWMGR